MSWESSLSATLVLSVLTLWWLRHRTSSSPFVKATAVLFAVVSLTADPVNLVRHLCSSGLPSFADIRLDVLLATHFRMVLTLGAVVWLLHRSWQTLWKPVPELINILGVDVPEPPDVSLAGIRSNAATLSWTRPSNNRTVQHYLIQVNGIHVGETPGNDLAITVTGLKPNHFYNIRVVAIGPNNFQAASHTVRLRTFGSDGKPYLGNARLPANFVGDDQLRVSRGDDCAGSDGSPAAFAAAAVEAAPVLEGSATASRDAISSSQGQRRNTVGRRHSPSVASADQPSIKPSGTESPEASLDELNQKFQEIRRDINDTTNQMATEDEEFQLQEDELKREKEAKKLSLKEKEEQTTQLKALIRTTMEQMRAAEKERLKKEQQLKEKEKKKSKVRDNITKFEKETDRMRKECQGFHAQKMQLQEQRDNDVRALDEKHAKLQEELNELEADLSNKGKLLNEMKEARKHLPGADNEQSRESDESIKREWEMARSQLHNQLVSETKAGHQLDAHYNTIIEQLSMYQQSAFYNQPDTSALDLDNAATNDQSKRLSHNSNELNVSPPVQFALSEAPSQGPPGLGRSPFVPILIMPQAVHDAQTEDDLRSAGGALSPSAHAYLPSGIIDFEASEPKAPQTPQLPEYGTRDDDPQSPASSSIFSSPHGSSLNLPFSHYQDSVEKMSINAIPAASPPSTKRLTSLLAGFQRSRNAKTTDEGGPPIGSLRPGQSQSFPRGTDEAEILESRRRISFSFKNHRNSMGPDGTPGLGSAGSKMLSRRLNAFGSASSTAFDRDPDASRPPSIASSDLPRPSTDSGSIWGVPGDFGNLNKNRLWSAEGRWPSRSGSRRPSIHGSPAALTTSLASADDEILYDTELMDPQTSPSQVGVIGSRPPNLAKSISQRLNPNAPTFMGLFSKSKDKDRERDKSRGMRDTKGKGKEVAPPLAELSPSFAPGDDSPSDPRVSRDTFSVHTQTSISESHDSLPLDASSSNTQLDLSGSLSRESDGVNGIRKLLRKGSSSKFSSLSSRLGKDSGLFKKGPGSATNSDRNTSADHRSSIGDLDELGAGEDLRGLDSLTGSPSLGPAKPKESKESRMSAWRFKMKKGKETPSKEKESMDLDRPLDEE